ncbi:flagella basal body P-ring formation protein FlgA [Helicobacter turcicus]|uniref:Flagella basal body P-ring formation protein FlgA n=1 Tax=Helicobacter turcicus TaxID=2867412 RepID=A0ABS7JMB9_9HELI|nr:flagella basal body P-ring formation protein FlgA [Helicobacter turcicus]MBX7490537.1 flagella basal body P-ring formation protein FlgA [Helicobacter turcicus]MBX7545396.1 flagella basal body P-ring formation protein FlgA [Helicobacter turcicus]
MRKIILFLLSVMYTNIVFGLDYFVLQKEYRFKNEEVYAKDLFPELPKNFFLFRIPNSSNNYQVKSSQIIRYFESEGIPVGAEVPIITFKRAFNGEQNGIKNHILSEFLREYKKNNIQIDAIHLEQITSVNFKEDAIKSIDFHSKLLKRNTGSFDVVVGEQKGKQIRNRKVYFKYVIDAKLQAIQSSEPISGRVGVSYKNARVVWIPFEHVSSPLMQEQEMGKVAVRSYTPKDVIITRDRLIPKRAVKKGDRILVSVVENGVLLEFVLEAQKDAAVGDVIKARVIDGKKTYKVEIIEEGKGKLL